MPPLELTTPEINALIRKHAPYLRDRVFIAIEGEQIKGQVSLRLADLPIPFVRRWTRGRYLNGSASFRASFEGGVLIVTLESLEVRGSAVPELVMEEIRKENLAKDLYKDPKHAELLARLGRKVERIEVKDGRILVLGKGARTL